MPVIPALRPEQHNAVALAPVVIGEVPSAGGVKPHQRLHPARSVKVRPLIAEAQMHFDHAATDGLDIQHAGVAAQVMRDPFAAIALDLGLAIGMHGPVTVSYTHLRAHETVLDLVCRLLLEKKKTKLI